MNAQQRLGRLVIALATLAGLAGFIANQIIFFQTHPTQAPEVYALTAIILVIVVLLGLLGGVLVTHGTQVVRRLPPAARRARSLGQQGASPSPASAAATELRHTSVAPMLALSASIVILALAVLLSVVMLLTHPVGNAAPSGTASPGGGRHTPPASSTAAPTWTPTPPRSPTSAPSSTSTAAPAPSPFTTPPQASPSPLP